MQLLIWLVLKDLADDASPLDRSDEWSQTDDDKMGSNSCFKRVVSSRMSDFEVDLLGDELGKCASPAKDHRVGFIEPVYFFFAPDDVVFIQEWYNLDDRASLGLVAESQVRDFSSSFHQKLFFLEAFHLRHLDQTSCDDRNFLIRDFDGWQAWSLPQCSDEVDDECHASGDLSKTIPEHANTLSLRIDEVHSSQTFALFSSFAFRSLERQRCSDRTTEVFFLVADFQRGLDF